MRGGLDPVWRRSPTLLLRYPALLAAVAFGSMLLTLAAAAYPLFMSATRSDLVRAAVARPNVTRYGAGLTYRFENLPLEPAPLFSRSFSGGFAGGRFLSPAGSEIDARFREVAAAPLLDEPVASVLTRAVSVSAQGRRESRPGRLFSSSGVLDHVGVLSGHDGEGVWMPDLIADAIGVGPGDVVELRDEEGAGASVVVDGVYRAVYRTPLGGYWYQWRETFRTPCPDCSPAAQPILADRAQLLSLASDLDIERATFAWQAPLTHPEVVTLEQALALERHERAVFARVSDFDDELGRVFACCGRWFFTRDAFFGGASTSFTSSIGFVVDDAQQRIAAVAGPTRVLEIAGVAVALVVVAAAGAFSVRARRVEAAWLFARGMSAAFVAGKTALESLLPSLGGGAVGLGVAFLAVSALGSGGRIEPSAISDAVVAAAAAVAAGLALIAVAAARTYVVSVDPHGRRFARLAAAIPWELALAALAFVALDRLHDGGAFVRDERLDVLTPSLALVAFPFLFLSGFALLAARLARHATAWLRGPTSRAGATTYLATRRLASGGSLAMLLVAAAALCLGTFLHARLVSGSLQTTVDAKAGVFVGSDVAGTIDYRTPVPETFPFPMTRAVRFASGARLPTGRPLDLVAVDAGTLAAAAYWQEGFADASLEEIARSLRAPAGDGVPAVLAGGGDLVVDRVHIGTGTTPIDVFVRASAFPGMYSLNPTLVVDEQTLLERIDLPFNPLGDARASTELWVRGDPDAVQEAFAAITFPPYTIVTSSEVKDIPYISAAIDTFVVVNALGLIAATLAFVGMLMYLQARQRSQVVSYALSQRMGMRHVQHVGALLLELGGMLAWAFVVGAGLAFVAGRATIPLLDPVTALPPEPLTILPLLVVGATAAAVIALTLLGAAETARRARAVNLGEVMRVAE